MKKLIHQKSIPAIAKYALTQMLKAQKKEVKAVTSWIAITSFLFAIFITYAPFITLETLISLKDVTQNAILLSTMTLLFVLSFSAFVAQIVSNINKRKWLFNLKRVLKFSAFYSVLSILYCCLGAFLYFRYTLNTIQLPVDKMQEASPLWYVISYIGIGLAITFIIILPSIYLFVNHIFNPADKLTRKLGAKYLVGIRNFGLLITISFAILLVEICFGGLIMLPTTIITLAKLFSLDGVLGGDPANLPDYFTALMIVSGTICTTLWCCIVIWKLLTLKHIYIRINSKEQKNISKTTEKNNETKRY
ncbi:MAG: hypothetical protein ACTTHI_01240 [Prevotella sp.]